MSSLKSIFRLKNILPFLALTFTNLLAFADDHETDVYVARAPVSDLNGHELLQQNWFWILVVCVALVLVSALLASPDKQSTEVKHNI